MTLRIISQCNSLYLARPFSVYRQCVRDWSGILCERISGTRFGNEDEDTEPVEVPRSNFGGRDGNMASKDIAESPTASPERPKESYRVAK